MHKVKQIGHVRHNILPCGVHCRWWDLLFQVAVFWKCRCNYQPRAGCDVGQSEICGHECLRSREGALGEWAKVNDLERDWKRWRERERLWEGERKRERERERESLWEGERIIRVLPETRAWDCYPSPSGSSPSSHTNSIIMNRMYY